MDRPTSLRAELHARLRAAIEEADVNLDELARLVGLHKRTVLRAIDGETCKIDVFDAIASALGVDLLTFQPQHPATPRNTPHEEGGDSGSPVTSWKQAAQVLGYSHDTFERHRLALGVPRGRPWWSSPAALRKWWGDIKGRELEARRGPWSKRKGQVTR